MRRKRRRRIEKKEEELKEVDGHDNEKQEEGKED